jgi:hypothetical protein
MLFDEKFLKQCQPSSPQKNTINPERLGGIFDLQQSEFVYRCRRRIWKSQTVFEISISTEFTKIQKGDISQSREMSAIRCAATCPDFSCPATYS